MNWLNKLERKMGRYYIRQLMPAIIAGMAVVYVLNMMFYPQVNIYNLLGLSRSAILQGQVWRLITFVFIPPGSSPFWLLFSLYFYYMMGTSLQQYWGGFRFNVYYLVGVLGAIASCFITGYGSNTYLNLSMFLAFATISPDTQFRLFFFIPVKAKWMALAYAVVMGVDLFRAFAFYGTGVSTLVLIAFSLVNYLLFFGGTLIGNIKEFIRIQQNRRNWRNRNR